MQRGLTAPAPHQDPLTDATCGNNLLYVVPNIMIIIGAALLLGGLLYFENREGRWGLLLTKTALSSLFIVAALVQPHPISEYYRFVLLGFCSRYAVTCFWPFPRKGCSCGGWPLF
jgi:hypothetical protein